MDGTKSNRLYNEVMSAFHGVKPPAYWYWQKHAGAAYKPMNGTHFRCTGHAALPWGLSSQLARSAQVEWFEKKNAGDPDEKLRVFNGFTMLELDADNLTETFYDELGRIAWTPGKGDTRG